MRKKIARFAAKIGLYPVNPTLLHVSAGLAISILVGLAYIIQPAVLHQTDLKIYDAYLRLQTGGTPSPAPVIVDIDEESIAAYGQWPWPRYLVAELLDTFARAGAASVALDFIIAEADRTSPINIQKSLKTQLNIDMGFINLPRQLQDNDLILAEQLKKTPAVLGMPMLFERNLPEGVVLPGSVTFITLQPPGSRPTRESIIEASGAIFPLPIFSKEAPIGTINIAADRDGIIRRAPMLIKLQDKIYPNLALRAVMRAAGIKMLKLTAGSDGLEEISLGAYKIPVGKEGNALIPFRGASKNFFSYYSAAEVLQGNVALEDFKGKIVFLGSTAIGLKDQHVTPFDSAFPGLEVLATLADAIISQRFIAEPVPLHGVNVLAILGIGFMAGLLFAKNRYAALILGLVALVIIGLSFWLFHSNIFFSPFYLVLTIVLESITFLGLRFYQEKKQKKLLRKSFANYVDPGVVERIINRGGVVLSGEKREITIMVSDIRGFTTLTEKLDPQVVVSLLNRFFTPMTSIIRSNGGTLDKFIGDALMAFWNAPLSVPDHPLKAVKAGLTMLSNGLDEVNSFLKEYLSEPLSIGVALHTGMAYVGNMGSDALVNYTAVGDNINLAFRLEALCPKYGEKMLASGETARQSQEIAYFQRLDRIRVKGRNTPVEVFSVLPLEEANERFQEFQDFEQAFNLYSTGHFIQAAEIFKELSLKNNQRLLYNLFYRRCETLQIEQPAVWDGIWNMF